MEGSIPLSTSSIKMFCDMQSSDQSPSRRSFLSYGDESRIDSELRYYAGGSLGDLEIRKEVVEEKPNGSTNRKSLKTNKTNLASARSFSWTKSKRGSHLSLDTEAAAKLSPRSKSFHEKPPTGGQKLLDGNEDPTEAAYFGPYLLKQTRELVSSGENPQKALELALRAMKSFENCPNDKLNMELVMCLHVLAALYCSLGQYSKAIPILERSIEIPVIDEGLNQALAKFSGCMQLGDTYAMIGQIENSILLYTAGLEIQREVLGEKDPRFGETCRYVAEAHVQAFQFDEAEKLCQLALNIHKENGSKGEYEASDRRLMGLICDSKGDYEAAIEHYVLASMAMAAKGQETEVASIDSSIGDAYLSLARYDEAIFSYQKALTVFKSAKGENHPSVASVFVRLADLYNKIGKFRESKSYCENVLRIYAKPGPGIPSEEIASGLIDISAIYVSMNEPEQAIKLLQKALKIYSNAPGQLSTTAGIEAQIGARLQICLKKRGVFLESEYGPYHHETLGVYSNLAGTYDAMGRPGDAIEILEYVVGMREEKLGTANPDVDDEKRRLAELLKESGRVRNRKFRSLETLLDTNLEISTKGDTKLL
ncbi:tetratricopeptide repeat (TPR)-like superfamily protein [Actinidia rufa]|uniref:Tetratricopeptide repeat (TPR)-like superfamily protein n=1 Tax=Actinidia rufa TaxID=165716 RepID=A0A7J0FBC2_9ERIC|nr:tetratricopeptide repeat (TPR)-like superfamily protein [Actinidia rufa]